jgi:hypothetical protein
MERLLWIGMGLAGPSCNQSVDPGQGEGHWKVTVRYHLETRSVDLGSFETATVENVQGVRLTDVIQEAFPDAPGGTLAADFVGADGFRPSGKSDCRVLIPLGYEILQKGVVDSTSGNLLWAASLGFGGCMGVSAVSEILIVDPEERGPFIKVRWNDTQTEVDLKFLPTTLQDGQPWVRLQTLVKSAGVSESPEIAYFDLEDGLGNRPGSNPDISLLDWEGLSMGSVQPSTTEVHFEAESGLSDPWNLADLSSVILSDTTLGARKVFIVFGEQQKEMDLGNLPMVEYEGVQQVVLQELIQAAALVSEPETFEYDLEGSDGFRPTVDSGATPLSYSALASGYIHPVSRNVSFDGSLGLRRYWYVHDVAKVHVLPKE